MCLSSFGGWKVLFLSLFEKIIFKKIEYKGYQTSHSTANRVRGLFIRLLPMEP